MIRRFFSKIKQLRSYLHYKLISPEEYAREIGVNIGDNCFCPDKATWSSEPYLITVGDNCQITNGVRLFTHGGGQAVRNVLPDFDIFGKIRIGNWVYIGNNSLILPGVTIGDNVLIAAGSVVTKSIPSKVVVAGNPAKIICTIDEYIEKNLKFNLNTKHLNQEQKKDILLNTPDYMFLNKRSL